MVRAVSAATKVGVTSEMSAVGSLTYFAVTVWLPVLLSTIWLLRMRYSTATSAIRTQIRCAQSDGLA
jgi:hypothetical protein